MLEINISIDLRSCNKYPAKNVLIKLVTPLQLEIEHD